MTDSSPLPRVIHLAEFAPFVGRTMVADCEPRPVPLELVEAKPLVNHARLDRPPFILIFRSAPNALLVQAAYAISAEGFGPDLVDLIPITRPSDGTPGHYYQAVFN